MASIFGSEITYDNIVSPEKGIFIVLIILYEILWILYSQFLLTINFPLMEFSYNFLCYN
jgi:hypothetical protein